MKSMLTADMVFGTRSRMKVLRVLHHAVIPLNTSQIAKWAGLSQPAAAAALSELAQVGISDSSSAGRARVHWIVRDNVYVQEMVNPVFRSEEAVPDILLEDLVSRFGNDAISIVLYGSYSRGDQRPDSDVDVVVVGATEAAKARLDETHLEQMRDFRERFGAPLSVIAYDATEARDLAVRSPEFLASLVQDGIVAYGLAPWEWDRIGH